MELVRKSAVNVCNGAKCETIVPVEIAKILGLIDKCKLTWTAKEVRTAIPGMSLSTVVVTVEKLEEL